MTSAAPHSIGIGRETFDVIASAYRRQYRIALCATDPEGAVVFGRALKGEQAVCGATRAFAVGEAARWGEPTVQLCPNRHFTWAVPLMVNARITGGLVAAVPERRLFPNQDGRPSLHIRAACADLRRLAEQHNVTNAALLQANRERYEREQHRAEAIHTVKHASHYQLRAVYRMEEPALIAAVMRGDRARACQIIDRLLVGVIHYADQRFDLVKSFFMELIVTLSRTAVEVGGGGEELLSQSVAGLSELAVIEDDEQIARWLHRMLDHVLEAIETRRSKAPDVMAATALSYMAEHCGETISRDDVADAVALSPAHFSRLIRQQTGRSFTQLLQQMRVDRACDLLVKTQLDIGQIALEAGFADQSYMTKVFRKITGQTPRAYRAARR